MIEKIPVERDPSCPPLLISICAVLDRAHIDYVILRRIEHLSDLGPRDDIDIVVKLGDLRDIQHVIPAELGLLRATCFLRKITPTNCQFAIFSEDQKDSRSVLRLDFQAGLWHQGTMLMSASSILSERLKYNGLWRPNAAAEALALLLHCVVTKGKFRDSDISDLERLFATEPLKFTQMATSVVGRSVAIQLSESLRQKTTRSLVVWRQKFVIQLVWPQFHRYCWGRLLKLFEIFLFLLKRRGALVVLVGPDGSGKTTLLNCLNKKLSSTGIKVTNVYFGLTTPLLPTKWLMRKLRHRKDRPQGYKDVDMTQSITTKKRITYFLGSCHAILDVYLRYYVYARFSLSRANIVLCDRYFYDILINPVPSQVYEILKVFVLYLTPKPDLTFVLMDDAAAIYARKPELSLTEIKRQQTVFQQMLLPITRGEILTQNPDVESVAEAALRRIIKVYAERNG